MKRTTLKDIAIAAGVNVSTVSRALKDHPDISAPIRNEIKKIAEQLHYRPNIHAVNLRNQSSKLIGLIVPEISMFFFPSVIKGIEEIVRQSGYQLMVFQANNLLEREIDHIQTCCELAVDGLLISLSLETKNLHHFEILNEIGIPVVIFDKTIDESQYDEVIIDDFKAASECVNHLIDIGCKNIAGIFGDTNLSITQKRLEGFRAAIDKAADAGVKTHSIHFANNLMTASACARDIIKNEIPDGIFAMSDELMAGVIPQLKANHVIIPHNCAVVAISDGSLPFFFTPSISHLHHDGMRVGSTSAKRLIEKIKLKDSGASEKKSILIPLSLKIQESTQKIIHQ